jgi:hypothetical protein
MGARFQVATCFINITKIFSAIVGEHSNYSTWTKILCGNVKQFCYDQKQNPKSQELMIVLNYEHEQPLQALQTKQNLLPHWYKNAVWFTSLNHYGTLKLKHVH